METVKRGASYREIGGPDGLLARMKAFDGNSMSARYVDGKYVVFSYATEIARVEDTGMYLRRTLNTRKYSVTTSRQQNLCAAWLPGLYTQEVAA